MVEKVGWCYAIEFLWACSIGNVSEVDFGFDVCHDRDASQGGDQGAHSRAVPSVRIKR